jgi:hypothetical protein
MVQGDEEAGCGVRRLGKSTLTESEAKSRLISADEAKISGREERGVDLRAEKEGDISMRPAAGESVVEQVLSAEQTAATPRTGQDRRGGKPWAVEGGGRGGARVNETRRSSMPFWVLKFLVCCENPK